MTTVIKIIADHLRANGFDGLVNEGQCGCELADLHPCDDDFAQCVPAYKQADPREGRGHVWMMCASKKPLPVERFDEFE